MKNTTRSLLVTLLSFLVALTAMTVSAQTSTFTYQGSLRDGASVGNGNYDMQVRIFADASGGSSLSSQDIPGVPVVNGFFTILLNSGGLFTGPDRYLELSVRPAGAGAYTLLSPRRLITSTPYAIKSLSSDLAANSAQLGGVAANQYILNNGNGTQLTNLNGSSITSGTIGESFIGLAGMGFTGRTIANSASQLVMYAVPSAGEPISTNSFTLNAVEANVVAAMPNRACVAGNLSVKTLLGTSPGANRQVAFNLRVNGVDTAVACTVMNLGTSCTSGAATAAIPAGAFVSLKMLGSNATTGSTFPVGFGWECR